TYQIVLTKADKVKAPELAAVTAKTEAVAKKRAAAFPAIHVTSSETGVGLPELRAEIAGLLG
ncbi:MAG: YihA family ribosome biogenesis GTP-binding protein, partial [Aestuariivirga sp.]